MNNGLDTDKQIFFYENDFYVFSNFSAFKLFWKNRLFMTSEHAYHWEKFPYSSAHIQGLIINTKSAHDAFKIAEEHKSLKRYDWDLVKVNIMKEILLAKASQHDYVRKKLIDSGNRELIENSWRDDFWGWGPNKDGKNMLGKLWMQIREEIKSS